MFTSFKNKVQVGQQVEVGTTRCMGVQVDAKRRATVTKVNDKSFVAGGQTFSFKKETADGRVVARSRSDVVVFA